MINILLFKFCWHYFQALSLHLLTKLLAFFSEFVPTPFTTDWYQHVQQWILWMETPMWPHVCESPSQSYWWSSPPFVLPSPPPLSCIESGDIPTCIFTEFVLVCRTCCRIFICFFWNSSYWVEFCSFVPCNIATWVFTELSHSWSNLALLIQSEYDRDWWGVGGDKSNLNFKFCTA